MKKKLQELRDKIGTNDVTNLAANTEMFGGAGVVIKISQPKSAQTDYRDDQYVVTNHAKELSWLIFELKEVFKDELDYMNKYAFYGRLAEAANKSIEDYGDHLKTLLADVLTEAENMGGVREE